MADEYRARAEQCEAQAERAPDCAVRAHLLELAREFRELARHAAVEQASEALLATNNNRSPGSTGVSGGGNHEVGYKPEATNKEARRKRER